MTRRKLIGAALFLTLFGVIAILPPPVLLFRCDARVFGVPVEIVYIFVLWAGLVAGAGWLSRVLPHDEPAAHKRPDGLALFAFIGGFSSAASLTILESIVVPIMLRLTANDGIGDGQGVRRLILNARRLSIILILFLGFGYFYMTRGSDALASIGLISFTGVAQFLPAIPAALFWRDASAKAAIAAVSVGFLVWLWASFMPSFASSSPMVAAIMAEGPLGIAWLRPQALFGFEALDPLTHAMFWSLLLNAPVLIVGSLVTSQSALEHVQAALFLVARRVRGHGRAVALFSQEAKQARMAWTSLAPGPAFIQKLERELSGSIGAAPAHVMLSKVVSGDAVSLEEVMQMADETQQATEHSQALERTSARCAPARGRMAPPSRPTPTGSARCSST